MAHKKAMLINFPGNQYTMFKYPAGEMQVRLNPETVEMLEECTEVTINARVLSSDDLIGLLHLQDAIMGTVGLNCLLKLNLPYLPYSRADRRFVPGDTFGLNVMLGLLSNKFSVVNTLDVHNASACWTIKDISPLPLIEKSIVDILKGWTERKIVVLFPDEGAAKRYNLPTHIGNNHEVIDIEVVYATKKRNTETGKFEGFTVPELTQLSLVPLLIVDDICDGGGTFNGIAEIIEKTRPDIHKFLYVTHGIFSKGYDELSNHFVRIYTTNSIHQHPENEIIKLMSAFGEMYTFASKFDSNKSTNRNT